MIDQLSGLEADRKAFRLMGGILVEKNVGEVLPEVQRNFEGVSMTLGYALLDAVQNLLVFRLISSCKLF